MIKRSILLLPLIVIVILNTSCNTIKSSDSNNSITVITTLFPVYDFAREIAGDKAEIILLLPPGVEAHAYEPTPQDIVSVQKSDLFIYTGELMEPWVHKFVEGVESDRPIVVDASKGVKLLGSDEHDEDEEYEHGELDPHIWLDPQNAIVMVDNITKGLVELDPENANYYQQNSEAYKQKLQELDAQISEAIPHLASKTIVYAGHFAFGYFAQRYGLSHISPYNGFAPDAEPTPQKVAELIDTIEESGVKAIYYEELIDPKVAKVISDETGVEMILLHGAHNVSKQELENGVTYLSIMEENLQKLKKGLGYNE